MRMVQMAVVAGCLLASGCATQPGLRGAGGGTLGGMPSAAISSGDLYKQIPQDRINTAARKLAAEGIRYLDRKNYRKASDLFNLAVKIDITNSQLHLLNAIAYQMRGINGESGLLPLAAQGYEQAVQADPSNWVARYYWGTLFLQQRDFAAAQHQFAEAALLVDHDPDVLYDLAVASYYNQDLKTAAAALAGLRLLSEGKPEDPRHLRASAIVHAALNQPDAARADLAALRKVGLADSEIRSVEKRVDDWGSIYTRSDLILAQVAPGTPPPGAATPPAGGGFPPPGGGFPPPGGGFPPPGGGFPPPGGTTAAPGSPFPAPGAGAGFPTAAKPRGPNDFVEKQMATVDVVILSTEENVNNTMGVNLLTGLKLQFGSSTAPGFSRTRTTTNDLANPANNADATTITRLISIPAVTYSLNIANADSTHDEVLARPTLVALGGQPSQFFSGTEILGAATAGGLGSAVQVNKEVGVKLSVLPEFLPDNLIKLTVEAERTFLTNPSANVVFDFRVDTTKTKVTANVVMHFGETLILSGLSEREVQRNRNGVPFLQDIPIVQYLFSQNATTDFYKSVLILVTPRRAQYTYRDQATADAERSKMSAEDKVLAEFEDKYRAWFRPIPNAAFVFARLDGETVGREFRTGDLVPRSWSPLSNHEARMHAAMGFLFY